MGKGAEKAVAAPLLNPKRKKQEDTSAGRKWFGMRSTEMTEGVKRDLQIIQNRNYLNPKQFFKAADNKKLPKFFHMGTVQEASHEFKTARLTKRQRKGTVADSLLADQSFRKYARRNYDAVTRARESGGKKALRAKQNKRKPAWARR